MVSGEPRLILQEGVLEEVETVQRQESSFLVSEVSCEDSKYKMWRTDPQGFKEARLPDAGDKEEDCGECQHSLAKLQEPQALHTITLLNLHQLTASFPSPGCLPRGAAATPDTRWSVALKESRKDLKDLPFPAP